MRLARGGALAVAALAGLVAGAAVTFALQDDPAGTRVLPPEPLPTQVARRPIAPDILLAWTPGRIPPSFEAGAASLRPISAVALVRSGTAWLTRSRTAMGAVLDRPGGGLAIPLEMAAVNPAVYRRFVTPADRSFVAELGRGKVILSQTSARLRRLGAGGTLRFGPVELTVAGVLPDERMGAHEVLASGAVAERLGVTRPRYALIDPAPGATKASVTKAIRTLLAPGAALRVRAPGETPFFRHGDAVLPPIALKEHVGEFAARPTGDGWMEIDRAWVRGYIQTAVVPILGRVSCARSLMPQFRGALAEIRRSGLAHLIDPGDYGGCYAPRFVSRDPGAGISHHAYGAAIDLNVSANPFGRVPSMHPGIVEIFESWGFTWGGRWLVPDGMHFDFIRPIPVGA